MAQSEMLRRGARRSVRCCLHWHTVPGDSALSLGADVTRFHDLLVKVRVDPEKLRLRLSDWHFWVGIAYVGLALTVVGLVVLFNRTAHEEATRTATQKAAATTQVAQCFTSVSNAPLLKGFIDAQEAIIENGLLSNQEAVDASSPSDPLYSVRIASIARLTAAKENVMELRRLILKGTPNLAKCLMLAHRLGIDPSRYIPRKTN